MAVYLERDLARNTLIIEKQLEQFQRSKREQYVVELFKRGLETEDCIAYHGTSLESIEYMIRTGVLPGYTKPKTNEDPDLPQPGDIYFLPRIATFPFELFPPEVDIRADDRIPLGSEEFALEECIGLAGGIAEEHYFTRVLQLPISIYDSHAGHIINDYGRDTPDMRISYPLITSLGITDEEIQETIAAAKQRKGVVIGLKNTALDYYQFSDGDAGDDFRLHTGKRGLYYWLVSGIKLLGPQETRFFRELQEHT